MLPYTSQPFYKVESSVNLPQEPLLIYSPQPQRYEPYKPPVLLTYGIQPSHQNNRFNSYNSLLPYFARQDASIVNQSIPFALSQKEINHNSALNGTIKLKPHSHNDSCKKIRSRNSCKSKFISIDLSHIKTLPPQEKLSLEQLQKPKRKFKLWTKEEDHLLLELKKNTNLNWRDIASRFPTRTLNACQYRIKKLQNFNSMKGIKENNKFEYIDK